MLPAEIVDHIFSFLEANPFTLQKCIECCPGLAKIIERHLYANITICNTRSYHPQIMSCFKLWELLSHSPHIANYVRSLTIKVTRPPFFRSRYILDVDAFLILQDKLRRLENVCLASAYKKPAELLWPNVHENIKTAFLTFLRLPTLKEVSIKHIGHFPLTVFDQCQNITRLLLQGDFYQSDIRVEAPYPQLDFLSLGSCPPAIIPWVKSRTLRSLDFRVDNPDTFQQLLEACPNTLVRLNADLNVYCTPLFFFFRRRLLIEIF